jgi:hypothetical protein
MAGLKAVENCLNELQFLASGGQSENAYVEPTAIVADLQLAALSEVSEDQIGSTFLFFPNKVFSFHEHRSILYSSFWFMLIAVKDYAHRSCSRAINRSFGFWTRR